MCSLGDDPRHVDIAADGGGILSKAVGGGGDAFHPGLGVNDQHHRQIECFGHHRSAGAIAIIEAHHTLNDADVALAAGVVAGQSLLAFEP